MASYNQIITAFTSIIDRIELQHSPVQLLNDLLHENHHSPNLPTLLSAIDAANDQECRSFLSELNRNDSIPQDMSVNDYLKTVVTSRIHEEITRQLNNLVSAVLNAAITADIENVTPKHLLLYKLIGEPNNTLSVLLSPAIISQCRELSQQDQIDRSNMKQALHAINEIIQKDSILPDTDHSSPLDILLRSLLANQDGLNNDKSITSTKEFEIAEKLSNTQLTPEAYKEQFSEAFQSEIDKNIESLIAKIYNEPRNPSTSEFTERKNSSSQNRTDSKIFNIDSKKELIVEGSTNNILENRENTGSQSESPSRDHGHDILSKEPFNQVGPQQTNLTTVFDWVRGPSVREKAENLAKKENDQTLQKQEKWKNKALTSNLSNDKRPYNSKKSLPQVIHKDPLILSSVIADNNQKDFRPSGLKSRDHDNNPKGDLEPSSSDMPDTPLSSSSALIASSPKESLKNFDVIPILSKAVKIEDDEADLTNPHESFIFPKTTEKSVKSAVQNSKKKL